MNEQNICKFIIPRECRQLVTTNFVYEKRVPRSGENVTSSSHILYLVFGGEGLYRCSGQCHRIRTGSLFFSFSGLTYSIENTDGLHYCYISFHGDRAEDLFRRFGVTPRNCVFENMEGLLPHWQNSLTQANEENSDLLTESLLLYTFSKLQKTTQKDDVISFMLTYLDNHFTDCALTLSEVAQAAGYNEKYLSHLFKKQVGTSFSEYLRQLRIRYAVMLIENGVTSVKNVAFLSGFSDPLYFSKVFTTMVGVSPSSTARKQRMLSP